MSNLLFNIRFWIWHFKMDKDERKWLIQKNDYHRRNWRIIGIYALFGHHF